MDGAAAKRLARRGGAWLSRGATPPSGTGPGRGWRRWPGPPRRHRREAGYL